MNNRSYTDQVHFIGRIWLGLVVTLIFAVPIAVCIFYNAWPPITSVLRGLLGVAPIFWTIGIIEVFTYVPMLGTGGSYVAFVTGNLTNLKIPCALNSMKSAKVEPGTEKGDVITTISICVSSIVTMVIIALGVFLLRYIQPVIDSPVLDPAFKQILPALFGALAVVFISKDWKIAIVPAVVMVVLFICIPALYSEIGPGTMVPIGAIIAIAAARFMYKRGWLKKDEPDPEDVEKFVE